MLKLKEIVRAIAFQDVFGPGRMEESSLSDSITIMKVKSKKNKSGKPLMKIGTTKEGEMVLLYRNGRKKKKKRSGISVEVARVSGAMRCGFGYDCRRDSIFPQADTLMEFLDNTIAYAKRERKKIEEELKRNKKRLKKVKVTV
jgi:hypothetical protein